MLRYLVVFDVIDHLYVLIQTHEVLLTWLTRTRGWLLLSLHPVSKQKEKKNYDIPCRSCRTSTDCVQVEMFSFMDELCQIRHLTVNCIYLEGPEIMFACSETSYENYNFESFQISVTSFDFFNGRSRYLIWKLQFWKLQDLVKRYF
jgi:hypothetical protein